MDRNTIIGLVLIFLILIGFSYFTRPSEEQKEAQRLQDSIAQVARIEKARAAEEQEKKAATYTPQSTNTVFKQDSLDEKIIILENNKITLHINTKGGRIEYVELKEYVTHDSLPLALWQPDRSKFGLTFYANNNSNVNTENMFFVPDTDKQTITADQQAQNLSLRLFAGEDSYIEYFYSMEPDSYMVNFDIRTHNMDNVIASNSSFITLNWKVDMPQLEKSKDFENRYTGVYYNFLSNDVEELSLNSNDAENLTTKVKWIAFKQQFFSSILIADESFNEVIVNSTMSEESGFLKKAATEIPLPFEGKGDEVYGMQFFFGPNAHDVLKAYGKDIELPKLINLGWKWVAWFNRYVVIPLFHFLQSTITTNAGWVIFLLTLIIKLFLFPLTYKSYLSQAKMRVLKPQIDEINKKYPADKAMERQKATMDLYKKAGVNPMGGCLPMLLQMPILIALFWFFPGAIELRQSSFLWATDLASYDSILDLPFNIPFYGDHVSLFCLLMTATNIIYMVMNNKNQPQNDSMKSMKLMMYVMPIMFLFIFNNYSSGLSYYYFITTLITIVQTWIIRRFMHDDKLLEQMEKAKNKPTKKSGFQQRLEQMQKMQQQKLKEQQKGKK